MALHFLGVPDPNSQARNCLLQRKTQGKNMILNDKSYIKTPKENVSLMHYLGLTQLVSIFKNKSLCFSTCQLYPDKKEGSLTRLSQQQTHTLSNLLWCGNSPVKQNDSRDRYIETLYDDDTFGVSEMRGWYRAGMFLKDTFEYLIEEFVRYFMFTHCWSLSDDEDILMWDKHKHRQPALAIKTTLERMQDAINMPMYVGEINYVNYERDHIMGYENFTEKNLTDKETIEELFYQPFFHKQKCYKSENEVRLIISYQHVTKHLTGETYITDIPFYHDGGLSYRNFGFDTNSFFPEESTDPKRFTKEDGENIDISQIVFVEINTNLLIEKIIISPYAKNYTLSIVRDIAKKYDFDPKKIINSPINIKT